MLGSISKSVIEEKAREARKGREGVHSLKLRLLHMTGTKIPKRP